MSTSDRHEQGPLTRKQLREIRLTGSTPVITPEEAAAAAAASTSPAPTPPREDAPETTTAQGTETPVDAVSPEDRENVGLTRRQIRERERLQAAAVETESTATPPTAHALRMYFAQSSMSVITARRFGPSSAWSHVLPYPSEPRTFGCTYTNPASTNSCAEPEKPGVA